MFRENYTEKQQGALQIKATSGPATSISMEERDIISSHLHEGLGQELVCLKIAAFRLSGTLEKSGDSQSRDQVHDLMMMIESILYSVRKMSHEIRPRVLQQFGLIAAIQDEVSELKKKAGASIFIQKETNGFSLAPDIELEVLRIVQEILRMMQDVAPGCDILLQISKDNNNGKICIKQSPLRSEKKTSDIYPSFLVLKLRTQELGGEMTTMIRNRKFITEITIPLRNEED